VARASLCWLRSLSPVAHPQRSILTNCAVVRFSNQRISAFISGSYNCFHKSGEGQTPRTGSCSAVQRRVQERRQKRNTYSIKPFTRVHGQKGHLIRDGGEHLYIFREVRYCRSRTTGSQYQKQGHVQCIQTDAHNCVFPI
jgi:hypothetical protein